jgi:hypothetical protein
MGKKPVDGDGARVITYQRLPGLGSKFGHADHARCRKWVMTTFRFGFEVQQADGGTQTPTATVDTFARHRGAVEPSLYLTPAGRWVYRIAWYEEPEIVPRPARFIEVSIEWATRWLLANGYDIPGVVDPQTAARLRKRKGPKPVQMRAHELYRLHGLNQSEVAGRIQQEFRAPFTQSQVSRAVRRVEEWLRGDRPEPEPRRRKRTHSRAPQDLDSRPPRDGGGRRIVRKPVRDDADD